MAGEWPMISLREAGVTLIDCDHRTPPPSEAGYPYVAIPQLRNGRIDLSDVRRITHEHFTEWTRKAKPTANDVVLSRRCNPGETAYVPPGLEFALGQNLVLLRADGEKLYAPFLRWLVRGPEWWTQISKFINVGAVFDSLRCADVPKFELHIPPIDDQRAIAHILGTLDDKIELNRRMNETLEAIARAIFKSWFVDFDPVRAKASGEPPESICRRLGLTPDLLALFPDRLVDSELGDIPEGWEVSPLEQLTCYLNRGLSPKYIEAGGVLVLNQKCVRDGRVDTSKGRRHDPIQRKVDGRFLEIGDLLVNSTGVGTLGRVAQILVIDEPTIVDSHVTTVRAAAEKVSWNYLGVALLERQSEIEALGEGSTGQTELSRARLGALSILLPPKPLRDYFDSGVISLRQRAMKNDIQSMTLAHVRDTLLPKLLSGELRVPDAGAA